MEERRPLMGQNLSDEDHELCTSTAQREASFLHPPGPQEGRRQHRHSDPKQNRGKIPEFPDSAYRLGQPVGVEARFPANRGESQIKFSWSYFRMGMAVNKLSDQSTDSLSRPLFEAEGHQGGSHPRRPAGM